MPVPLTEKTFIVIPCVENNVTGDKVATCMGGNQGLAPAGCIADLQLIMPGTS
jgi:hypothetical protein